MSDRFFQNNLIDYSTGDEEVADSAHPAALHSRPFKSLEFHDATTAKLLAKAAVDLKKEVVQATWISRRGAGRVQDPSLYTGLLGTAFLCLRSFEILQSTPDLSLCLAISDSCAASAAIFMKHQATFICGRAGIYAVGAVAAKYAGDTDGMRRYLDLFNEIVAREGGALAAGPAEGGFGMPYELMYGRAGFLWACLFINKHIGQETIPWSVTGAIVEAIVAAGKVGGAYNRQRRGTCAGGGGDVEEEAWVGGSESAAVVRPLMYAWHGVRYWGAAHGLAGVMHVLLMFMMMGGGGGGGGSGGAAAGPALGREVAAEVRKTLQYMVGGRLPGGNYPSSEGNSRDRLVQWCHGAPGVALTLATAAQVFPPPYKQEFTNAALDAGEVVWRRGLLRKVGLCHGVSGNAYTFLALYRLTGNPRHLHRARAFAMFLHEHAMRLISSGQMHGGDHPYSLFEGLAGTSCLWLDMLRPFHSRFPAYEL